jgi:hypothetical protein
MRYLVTRLPLAAVIVFSLAGGGRPVQAALAAPREESILQQELKQQQLQATTGQVGGRLATIIEEFERNAIAGEDLATLKAIREVLGVLSARDMQRVVEYLQRARQAADPGASAHDATEAYARQKAIIAKLKALEAEYRRQAELYELSLRFKEFANRQSTYMGHTADLAKRTEGRQARDFSETQQNDLNLLRIDQEPLKDEVLLQTKRLERLAAQPHEGPTAHRPQQALRQTREGGLFPALDGALDELKAGRVVNAWGQQREARNQFREIARLLLLSRSELEVLRQAAHELDQAMDQQRQVMEDTRTIPPKDTRLEPRQAELVDTADLIRRDLDGLAPLATAHLATASDRMQEARSVLTSEKDAARQREKAPPKQAEALAAMEEARRALQEQMARAEENASQPESALAALKELQQQVRDLARQQQELKDATATARKQDLPARASAQGDLKDQARELQQQAAGRARAATQSLTEAAAQMQKAQVSLAAAQNNAPAQQAALDALQRAEDQLAQDVSRLERAQQDLAALEHLLDGVGRVIEHQQQVQLDTAKAAAKRTPEGLPDLSRKQETLGRDTGLLQQQATAPAPTAATHLANARAHMGQARGELDQRAPARAQPQQAEALKDLYSAKGELERQADELRRALGLPTDERAPSLADAAALIGKAQHEVAQARGEMQESPAALMDSLLQQQQQIADGLGQLSRAADGIPAVQQAQKASSQAARELAQSNLEAAVGSMRQSQDAMQRAMKSARPAMGSDSGAGQAEKPSSGREPGDPGGTPDPRDARGLGILPKPETQEPPPPSLPGLSGQQERVREMAEALLASQQATPAAALDRAAQLLEQAHQDIAPLTAGEHGALPGGVEAALQAAQASLTSGAAEALAGQSAPAQRSAANAAEQLSRAQAALSLAQAGLGTQAFKPAPGQSQAPGSGQAQGPGRAQSQDAAQSRAQGEGQGQGMPGREGAGRQGNWDGPGGADGPRRATTGPGGFTRLPPRDRAAIQQSQAEKYPQEYGPMVEQYLRNLSDQAGGK